LGLDALRLVVLPEHNGLAAFIAAVVTTPASGVPVQLAGTASKPNKAVAASAVPVVLVGTPYIRPFRPVTEN
jgi:hypothetical protein